MYELVMGTKWNTITQAGTIPTLEMTKHYVQMKAKNFWLQ